MEAASPSRELSGEKAQRIVDAMRTSVGLRGATGSTFDHVAREAGVSRGLLHYYFGTKERLLVEVVRRDCDLRMERLSETLAGVDSADALLGGLAQALTDTIDETRGGLLAAARAGGVIRLAGEPDAVAEVLFSLADGLAMRMLVEPTRDYRPALATATAAARALVQPV